MGKKSRRNNKNNGGPLRQKGLAAVPSEAAPANIFKTICHLMNASNLKKILKIESKYRHLDTFSDDPDKDLFVLTAFGRANFDRLEDEACMERAIHYYERAKECMEASDADDQRESKDILMSEIRMCLVVLYSDGRDMEKAISSHRSFLENCNRHEVTASYVIDISRNFNHFEKFEYTIEVLEGSMDLMETFDEKIQAEISLIYSYIGCGEFLKAKAAHKKHPRSADIIDQWVPGFQSARIEEGMCNYQAAIALFRKVLAELLMQENDDSLNGTRVSCSVGLANNLMRYSADNEAEAFAIFQEELDRCVDPLDREMILFDMGTEYRKINKWDQSIETLHQLCLSSTRPDGAMVSQGNGAIAQTYLEQYCTDTTLDIDQRTQILCCAKRYSFRVHIVSTETHLTQAQLSYFNGDKHEAYRHLKLYLDARLAECKLSCYSCKQRVRHGSVPFSCASCLVASYCGRKHQKLTWKNERICHKVLCPLFGYWRMAKKKQKKRQKHKGLTNEDRCEYERVFETFFESICPHVKTCVPSYYDGLTFVD